MVTDFSTEDEASVVKFCTAVHWRPKQEISHFEELFSSRSPKSDDARPRVHGPRIGSACVDIRPSPKTDVLVKAFTTITITYSYMHGQHTPLTAVSAVPGTCFQTRLGEKKAAVSEWTSGQSCWLKSHLMSCCYWGLNGPFSGMLLSTMEWSLLPQTTQLLPLIQYITSANIDRFSKFFHCQIPEESLYVTITGSSTSP